jgi:hypothetical protein
MTEIRIEAAKAEQIITQILRDDESLPLADANAVAANICRRLLTIRTNSPVDVYRIIPREPPYGADFATAVATKLAEAKNGPETANQLWQLVYDRGRRLRVA